MNCRIAARLWKNFRIQKVEKKTEKYLTKCDSSAMIAITVRACTGFDRPAEDGEAIRGP